MLTDHENSLLDSLENGEWVSKASGEELRGYQEMASQQHKKDKRITLRINNSVLTSLQKKALKEEIPYQTLITSILHKYLSGKLKET